MQPGGFLQQAMDRRRDRGPVAERHLQAMAIGQQLLGVPVGGAHHRLAGAVAIRKRAGGDLGGVEIGSEVDVGGTDGFDQLLIIHVAVDEDHVVFHPQALGQALQ
jgi:hypothetical protein